MALTKATLIDLNSNELILDLDADTSITADTDDTIHFKIAGADEIVMTGTALTPAVADGSALGSTSLEWSDIFLADGAVINFGADQDVTLTHVADSGLALKSVATADDKPVTLVLQTGETDIAANDVLGVLNFQAPDEGTGTDAILVAAGIAAVSEGDFSASANATKLSFRTAVSAAASETMSLTSNGDLFLAGGLIDLKNDGNAVSQIKFYCESSNAHAQTLIGAPHAQSATNTLTLPDGSDGVLVSTVSTATLTNKTLTTPVIAEIDSGSTITLDATTDIILDADGGDIIFKDGGTSIATFTNSSTDLIIETATSDKDIIFKVNDGGSSTEVFRVDGDVSALLMASGKELRFADSGEKISGNGTDLTLNSGADINLTATTDINIPANVGLTFGDDAEKIEGDGTDLTISGNNIKLTAATDVIIPTNVGLHFTDANEKIESDGSNIKITSGGTEFTIPASDGSNGQVLQTNGSGVLSFATPSTFDADAAQTFNDSGASVDFRVESNTDANCLIVDGSGDKVGIGVAVPEAKLHIFTGDASVGPNGDADELVVEGSGASGISILSGNSSTGTLNFGDSGDDNIGSLFYDHSSNYMAFQTSGVEGMRVQSNGKLYINHIEDISTGHSHQLQVAKNNTAASMVVHAGLNTDGAGNYTLSKSRHATPGSGATSVNDNDVLGTFRWIAADGNDLTCIAATIDARVDGSVGQDDIPARMSFAVAPDGANSPTERFRISQNGNLTATDYGGSIGNLSDQRMKENIADFTYNLSTFKSLRPRQFTWKNPAQHSGTGTKRGFIAQEIGAVDSLFSYDYTLNKEDLDYGLIYNNDPESADYGKLLDETAGEAKAATLHSKDAMYVSIIKQLITKIETLETKVQALEDA